MKSLIILLCPLVVLLTGNALAQPETQPMQLRTKAGVVEEFSVLKADSTVRQGAYIRYHMSGPMTEVAVYEVGQYDHGRKQGEWRCFAEDQAWNRLLSRGSYRAGLPEGPWCYYHYNPQPAPLRRIAFDLDHTRGVLTVDTDDTTAVVQAKGMCLKGERAGLWRYYDKAGTLIQAINHSSNQLLYCLSETGQPLSGEAMLATHPLLYVGGNDQLKRDLARGLSPEFLRGAGKTGSIGVVFSVDATGRQTGIQLTSKAAPTRYERLLLTELGKIPTRWLPQQANGQPLAATRYVVINTTVTEKGAKVAVELYGI